MTACLLWVAPLWAADTAHSLQRQQAQLEQLRGLVDQAASHLKSLNAQLQAAQARSQQQDQHIAELEKALAERDPGVRQQQQALRQTVFAALRKSLPTSPVYRVEADHLVIAADPVFVFSRGEIGAEGRDRLSRLGTSLLSALRELPNRSAWKLRVEGHTDSRPLRTNPRFANNWQLSAARAVSMLELLRRQGLAEKRLSALALAATRPLNKGQNKAEHRRNRRIEIHLEFHPAPD